MKPVFEYRSAVIEINKLYCVSTDLSSLSFEMQVNVSAGWSLVVNFSRLALTQYSTHYSRWNYTMIISNCLTGWPNDNQQTETTRKYSTISRTDCVVHLIYWRYASLVSVFSQMSSCIDTNQPHTYSATLRAHAGPPSSTSPPWRLLLIAFQ